MTAFELPTFKEGTPEPIRERYRELLAELECLKEEIALTRLKQAPRDLQLRFSGSEWSQLEISDETDLPVAQYASPEFVVPPMLAFLHFALGGPVTSGLEDTYQEDEEYSEVSDHEAEEDSEHHIRPKRQEYFPLIDLDDEIQRIKAQLEAALLNDFHWNEMISTHRSIIASVKHMSREYLLNFLDTTPCIDAWNQARDHIESELQWSGQSHFPLEATIYSGQEWKEPIANSGVEPGDPEWDFIFGPMAFDFLNVSPDLLDRWRGPDFSPWFKSLETWKRIRFPEDLRVYGGSQKVPQYPAWSVFSNMAVTRWRSRYFRVVCFNPTAFINELVLEEIQPVDGVYHRVDKVVGLSSHRIYAPAAEKLRLHELFPELIDGQFSLAHITNGRLVATQNATRTAVRCWDPDSGYPEFPNLAVRSRRGKSQAVNRFEDIEHAKTKLDGIEYDLFVEEHPDRGGWWLIIYCASRKSLERVCLGHANLNAMLANTMIDGKFQAVLRARAAARNPPADDVDDLPF